ncbi:MAG TPA: hypothetical protein VFY90_05745 [Tepidiformaceae bacterium]|nr:hypothetical protein [Tepidiformaceae bacterium]HSE45459.1 hypothetical protein [Gemmatimonadales bacterium]
MNPKLEACPFDTATRASRCENCCSMNRGVPPCVVAWLAAGGERLDVIEELRPVNVVTFARRLRLAA